MTTYVTVQVSTPDRSQSVILERDTHDVAVTEHHPTLNISGILTDKTEISMVYAPGCWETATVKEIT